jgi:hypothetical protein
MTQIIPDWLVLDRSKSAEPEYRQSIQNIDADQWAARAEREFRRELAAGRDAWDHVRNTFEVL